MSKGQNNSWLAAHLYYNEPWEAMLTNALEPYVSSVMRAGVADQYFFIRYWERGPHIRLRFKAGPAVIEQLFRPNLVEHFENYFEDKPSKRTNPDYPLNFPDEFKWYPNNSVQFFNYKPEVERYGGLVGVQIAEEHFQISSDIVLKSIKEKGFKWIYDDALGAAIKLHLSFIHTMGLDLKSAVAFFKMLFYNWLPRALQLDANGLSKEACHKKTREIIDSFSRAYEAQKTALLPFHKSLWEGLEAKSEFDEAHLNIWVLKNSIISAKLNSALRSKQLVPKKLTFKLPAEVAQLISDEQEMLWNFYADYIHMTNNRLGILNEDEGYLGFLIMQSLKTLESNQTESTEEMELTAKKFEQIFLDEFFLKT